MFERPCCGGCDLLCYSCTGRSRAFHRARSSKWTTASSSSSSSDPRSGLDDSSQTVDGERSYVRLGAGSVNDTEGGGGGGPGAAKESKRGAISTALDNGSGGGGHGGAESPRKPRVSVRGDNWLGTHEAALLRVAGLHDGCEVVDAQFESGIEATPYCVLVDHNWRCVVVSIRGTMSLDDCLCDLQADPACMEESGRKWGFDGTGMFAHQVRFVFVFVVEDTFKAMLLLLLLLYVLGFVGCRILVTKERLHTVVHASPVYIFHQPGRHQGATADVEATNVTARMLFGHIQDNNKKRAKGRERGDLFH